MEKKPTSHIVAGLVVAGLIILYTIILYFTGLHTNQALGWVSYGLLVIGVAYFVTVYAKANDNLMSFGNLFGYGFKVTAFAALVFIAFLVIFNLIFPEFREKLYDSIREKMEQQGKMSEDQITTALEMTKKFFMVGLIMGSMFMFAIFGAIGALIGAGIAKKNPPATPFENTI